MERAIERFVGPFFLGRASRDGRFSSGAVRFGAGGLLDRAATVPLGSLALGCQPCGLLLKTGGPLVALTLECLALILQFLAEPPDRGRLLLQPGLGGFSFGVGPRALTFGLRKLRFQPPAL